MRIDEFSNTAGIDGALSSTEQTRFMCVGFDIAPGLPADIWLEIKSYASAITLRVSELSAVSKLLSEDSLITKTINRLSKLGG